MLQVADRLFLADNRHYGPEFATPFAVVWLAVAKSSASVGHSRSMDFQAFIRQELGTQRWQEITRDLAAQGKSIDDYQLMPVHPWQWDNVTVSTFYPELASGELIYPAPRPIATRLSSRFAHWPTPVSPNGHTSSWR